MLHRLFMHFFIIFYFRHMAFLLHLHSMKAAVYHKYGPPEVVQVADIPQPQPKDHEIRVRVYASTVNRTDTGFRSAQYVISRLFSGIFVPRNKVLGNEFAGVVETVGKNVTLFHPGDRVFGFNDKIFGAHAEYMVLPETAAMTLIPEGMTFEEAAPLTEGAHYALCDIRAAQVQRGQRYLVNGATGAIGSAAIQLLKHFGVEVTAVCNTQNVELVRSLGADRVIDYMQEDFTKCGDTFDVVFDAVGKSTFGKCKPLLKPKGIYMSTELGPGSQNPFWALFTPLTGGKRVLFPLPSISRDDVEFLKELAVTGQYKPVTDRVYTLDEITEAHRYVDTGQKTGNVVIRVVHDPSP